LTAKLVELNRLLVAKMRLVEQAKPFLRELARRSAASAHLAVLRDWQVVYLDEELPSARIRVDVHVGGLAPAHCTALGKAILSHLDDTAMERFLAANGLPAYTRRTLTTKESLGEELRACRQRGYAIDDEEFHEGVRCLAAPVRDLRGKVVAAIGISGPAQRFTPSDLHSLSAQVMDVAARLSQRLGYRPADTHPA
jgi:DNA-binding IclR family transcriptional regulator